MVASLVLRVFPPVSFDLDNQVQEVLIRATAVINQDHKVRDVVARLRTIPVRHLKSQIVVLHVCQSHCG